MRKDPPGRLSGERVGLTTWLLLVRSPVEATFLSGVFSPRNSAEACEKSSRWLWKESCVSFGMGKPGNICVTDRPVMTSAVKMALNLNTNKSPCAT